MKFLRAHSYNHFREHHNLNARRAFLAAILHTHGLFTSMDDMTFIAREVRTMTNYQLDQLAKRCKLLMAN